MTQHSLDALLDISRHPVFGPAMRTVILFKSCPTFPPFSAKDQRMDIAHDSGLITTCITQVLRNAVNCRRVVLSDTNGVPWGNETLERETGCNAMSVNPWLLSNPLRRDFYFYEAFRCIIVAMTDSDLPITVVNLSTNVVPALHDPRTLQFLDSYGPCLTRSRWANTLTTLYLQLGLDGPVDRMRSVTDFIGRFPLLEYLDLEFEASERSSTVSTELLNFHQFCQHLLVPKIRTLSLMGPAICLSEDLMTIFDRHSSTLVEISLTYFGITAAAVEESSWESLFDSLYEALLRDDFQHLKEFCVSNCTVEEPLDFDLEDIDLGTLVIAHDSDEDTDEEDGTDGDDDVANDDGDETFRIYSIYFEENDESSNNLVALPFGDPVVFDRMIEGLRRERLTAGRDDPPIIMGAFDDLSDIEDLD